MLIFIVLLLLVVLYFLIPRGTLLHEATRLPALWIQSVWKQRPGAEATKFSYGEHPRQNYLFCPAPRSEHWIIYFHGGSWRWGKPDFFLKHARVLNDLGFNVILPSYRPCPKHNYQHISQDLIRLLRILPRHHSNWSAARTLAGGMSAGGHLAALLALDTSLIASALPGELPLAGFFALGAPLDLRQMPPSFPVRDLAGPKTEPLFTMANPAAHLPLNHSQRGLIIHGEEDGMVPTAAATAFIRQAETGSGNLEAHLLQGETHLSIAAWPFNNLRVKQMLINWLAQCKSKSPLT